MGAGRGGREGSSPTPSPGQIDALPVTAPRAACLPPPLARAQGMTESGSLPGQLEGALATAGCRHLSLENP